MDNHNKLLSLYNELDSLLREKYHENNRSNSVILRYTNDLNRSGSDKLAKVAKKLDMIRVIRNNLIHELDMNSESLIEVNDSAIEFLQWLIEEIKHPQNAYSLCTKIKDVFRLYFDDDTPLGEIMTLMREKGHSQVPVVNHQNILKGVFSPNVVFSYLTKHPNEIITNIPFSSFCDECKFDKHFSETYKFIASNTNEVDVNEIFLKAFENNQKLVMAFVTQSGRENEPVLGIIVLKDLLLNE